MAEPRQSVRKSRRTLYGVDDDQDLDDDYFDYDDDIIDYDNQYDDDDDDLQDGTDKKQIVEEEEEEKDEEEEEEEGSEDEDSEEEKEGDEDEEEEEAEDEEEEQVAKEEGPDEATIELRARKLSIVTFLKEELILEYLETMKRVIWLRKHNLYIQNYLYRLCIRKKLIIEDEMRVSTTTQIRRANRLKRQKKRHDVKMKANFEVFRTIRPPSETKLEAGPSSRRKNRGMLKRARQLNRPDVKPPHFLKKLDAKEVNIHGVLYQRILRSRGRDWTEDIAEQDDTAIEKIENPTDKKKAKGGKKNEKMKEVHMGHPDVPASYQRTLTPYNEAAHVRKKRRKATREPLTYKTLKYDENFDMFDKPHGYSAAPCKGKDCGEENKVKGYKSFILIRPLHQEKKPGLHIFPKIHCRKKEHIKERKFCPINWFFEGKLKGRRVSGNNLLPLERQHLLNFVNRSNFAKNNAPTSQKPLGSQQEWQVAVQRLYHLSECKVEMVSTHEETMQNKMVEWGLWEKRNLLTIQDIFSLFKEFVMQPYFSANEKRTIRREINQFGDLLFLSHTNLLTQLYRMYKGNISLLLLQRRVKDKTNQALVKQGYTLADYELRLNESKQMSQSLLKKENDLEQQSEKLGLTIKQVLITRDNKDISERNVSDAINIHRLISEDCNKGKVAALAAMQEFQNVIRKNKPFLLRATMVDRRNLLRDFTTRKRAMHQFESEVHRRQLVRDVYLRERELNSIQVKTQSFLRNLSETRESAVIKKEAKEMKAHKERLKNNLQNVINEEIAHCRLREDPKPPIDIEAVEASKSSVTKKTPQDSASASSKSTNILPPTFTKSLQLSNKSNKKVC